MKKRVSLSAVLLVTVMAASPAWCVEVTGHVRVKGRTVAGLPTIIYAESTEGRTPVRPGVFKIIQKNKAFIPHVLAVPAGSTVEFPNEDPIFHNVFSLSRPRPFDLGLYRSGASKTRVFLEPAAYRIFCNIHPQMTAVILVLPTSFITEAYPAGAYRLDLPPGRYRLTAWSERAQPFSMEISVGQDPVVAPELSLDESNFVQLPHKNKFGQDYPGAAYDPLEGPQPR